MTARRSRLAPMAGGLLLGAVLVAWATSLVAGFDVVADVDPGAASRPPSAEAWLGTDHMGRDVFWRLVTASEAFVGPGLLACAVSVLTGLPAGALSGYRGGPVAQSLRYAFTVLASVPRFVLVLLACAIYGNEPVVLAVAAGVAWAPTLGEAVHSRIETLRSADFVIAARAHGVSGPAILAWHLLWVNCRRLVGRHLLASFGYFLFLETTLSFIGGFGIEEPMPSWGNMLAFEFRVPGGNPWAWAAPALATWATILATAMAGEALAERGRG